MIVNIADPSCDVVKILKDFAADMESGVAKSYKDKKEFDGLVLYRWVCKDNLPAGCDPLNLALMEFDQALKCTNDLLTVWMAADLISRDDFTRHYFVK